MLGTEQATRSAFRAKPRAVVRFVLHSLIKLLVLGILTIWRFKPLVVIVVASGAWFWWANGGSLPLLGAQRAAQHASGVERISQSVGAVAPAEAAEQYLWGQSHYDANVMWAALSDDMKRSSARSGGITLQRLAQQLDEQRQGGLHYDPVRYIGGHLAPDGRGFYLYVVGVSNGTSTRYVPYTFTISSEGKIVNID